MDRNYRKRKCICAVASMMADFFLNMGLDSESDDGDTDDEELLVSVVLIKRIKKKPVRIVNYVEYTVQNYTKTQFQQHFRVTVDAYEALLQVVAPSLKRQGNIGRHTIDIEKQVLAVIWLIATPDSYRSVGERFDLGKSSLSVCFMRVIQVLCALAHRIITWPRGERLQEIKEKWSRINRFPNIIGAVDGTFILIKAPKVDPQSYITRKCNYAMTLQAICDPYLKFSDIFVGYPGSVSDIRIFRNSPIYARIQDNPLEYFANNEHIIGDKAYPLLTWCIPPYINRGNLEPAQRQFNTKHAQCRQVIERSFALLFGRFRRLKFIDMNRHDLIPNAVLAACVLHNVCLEFDDLLIEEYIREGMNHIYHNEEHEVERINIEMNGRRKRDRICQNLYQP